MNALPSQMNVIEIREPGRPDVLVPARRDLPRPGPGEVLIAVHAAGINRPDLLQRMGLYPPPPGASDIPGLEVAGEVVALGEGVDAPALGARVCALLAGGGYAEYVAVPAPQCLPVPRGLDMLEAAAVPETFFTVWTNVFDRGRLQPGETLLVHGGASGIGTTAIQLASALGARVFATAGSAEKCGLCRELGAELAVNYREEDFVQACREATGGRGVDVILDMVAGDYVPRNLELAAPEGRIVVIGFLGGWSADLDLRPVMIKRLTLTGSTLRARSVSEKGQIARALAARVWPLLEAGNVRPRLFRVFPLAGAAEAHALMESGQHSGKIVLQVRP